jgi:hypothetical protein
VSSMIQTLIGPRRLISGTTRSRTQGLYYFETIPEELNFDGVVAMSPAEAVPQWSWHLASQNINSVTLTEEPQCFAIDVMRTFGDRRVQLSEKFDHFQAALDDFLYFSCIRFTRTTIAAMSLPDFALTLL